MDNNNNELESLPLHTNDDLLQFRRGFVVDLAITPGNGFVITIEHPEDHRHYRIHVRGAASVEGPRIGLRIQSPHSINGVVISPGLLLTLDDGTEPESETKITGNLDEWKIEG